MSCEVPPPTFHLGFAPSRLFESPHLSIVYIGYVSIRPEHFDYADDFEAAVIKIHTRPRNVYGALQPRVDTFRHTDVFYSIDILIEIGKLRSGVADGFTTAHAYGVSVSDSIPHLREGDWQNVDFRHGLVGFFRLVGAAGY